MGVEEEGKNWHWYSWKKDEYASTIHGMENDAHGNKHLESLLLY